MLENLVQFAINLLLSIISSTGYAGIFFLMLLGSSALPIGGEIVMPFAGYLVWKGEMNFWLVISVSTLGNLAGALISYFAGLHLGRAFILKYCKYVLLSKQRIFLAERWFEKYGGAAVFVGRFLPVIRTVISLPAGIAKMDLKKFVAYTFIGSLIWCIVLAYFGMQLGNSWENVYKFGHYIDATVVVGVVFLIAWYFLKIKKGRSVTFEGFGFKSQPRRFSIK